MAMNAGIDCTGARTPVGSPMPTHCTARMSSANAGSARPMLAMFTAIVPPRAHVPEEDADRQRDQRGDQHRHDRELQLLARQARDRLVPCHWSELVRKSKTSPKKPISATAFRATCALPGARPGRREALREHEQHVGDDGEREREHDADGERGAEVAIETVEHQGAQPALADRAR